MGQLCMILSYILTYLYMMIHIVNPQRACAAKVTVLGLCVCLFVCLSTTILELQATGRLMSDTVLQGHKKCGDFAETTAFERYGEKTSEKANMHNEHWLTSIRFSPFSAPWTN